MKGEQTYKIVRFYRDWTHPNHGQVIKTGLTLDEAQAHCNDPATQSYDQAGEVAWFDGYESESPDYDERNWVERASGGTIGSL